jgi:selenium-binding protein 1
MYASPQDAQKQPPEDFVYVACLYEGTGINEPDFIAVVDVNPESDTYSQIVHRTSMPNVGDELHHFGWNVCSSACHSDLKRDTLVVPGIQSSRIHIVDVSDPQKPEIAKVIEGDEIKEKTGYSGPHTVHCMPGDIVTISMLGDAEGNLPGGFAVLDSKDFSVLGRWEEDKNGQEFMYDFWYSPRQNTLLSSEWGAPNTFRDGFNPEDVAAGKYGKRLHFWDLERKAKIQTIDLGDEGLIPLEIRWQHDPDSTQGFVGATLSSNIIRFSRNGEWTTVKVIDVANEDRDLFFSNWLHGDLRHYDVSDPSAPQLKSQVWLGGLLGRDAGHPLAEGPLNGGPQMLQASLDGDRVYVTNSLYSTWDNQFYPEIRGWMTRLTRQDDGTFALDPTFFVDFTKLDTGPARPHEIHLPGGDCTTEIFP